MTGAGRASLVLLLAAAGHLDPAAARSQEPQDTVAPPPEAQAPPAQGPRPQAQAPQVATPSYRPPRVALSVTAGPWGVDDLQSQPIRADRLGTDTVLSTATLRHSLGARDGIQATASLLWNPGARWGVRVAAGFARATLVSSFSGDDDLFVLSARRLVNQSTDLNVLTAEAALRYRILSSRRVQPYVEMGAVGQRWETDGLAPGAADLQAGDSRVGVLAALGGVVPLVGPLSARFQASARVFRAPVGPAAAGQELARGTNLALTFEPSAVLPFADPEREVTRVVRLEAGLRLGLGRTVRAQSDPVGSPGSP